MSCRCKLALHLSLKHARIITSFKAAHKGADLPVPAATATAAVECSFLTNMLYWVERLTPKPKMCEHGTAIAQQPS
jgi:hypothetical protein